MRYDCSNTFIRVEFEATLTTSVNTSMIPLKLSTTKTNVMSFSPI